MTVRKDAKSNRRLGKRVLIAQVLATLILIASLGMGLIACTVETGPKGTTSTVAGFPNLPTTDTTKSTDTTKKSNSNTTKTTASPRVPGEQGAVSPAFLVAEELGPSVVNISITGTVQNFFGQFQEYAGEGSGVIYREDGMIITNNHVVEDESGKGVNNLEVTLTTGEKLSATVIGRDPFTDLAVIKVNADVDLPAAKFVDRQPDLGEYAIAIGSPLGFANSVTLGIVSGLNRSIPGAVGAEGVALNNLIQTDAAISPGNSGGALANANGEVIGINVAYLPPAQTGAVSIGFAIPSVVATKVADEIIDTGRATHAYLGVGTQTVTSALQQQFSLSRSTGIIVAEVSPNGPAAKAGVRQGDIIVGVDGEKMTISSDLLVSIREKKAGDIIKLTIDRDGKEVAISVTLEERPKELR